MDSLELDRIEARATEAINRPYLEVFAEEANKVLLWKGEPIEKFAFRRQMAAQAMGLKIGAFSPDEILQSGETGGYPGLLSDAAYVLWLRRSPISIVEKAIRLPTWGVQEAVRWAEKEGLTAGNELTVAAVEILVASLQEMKMESGNFKRADGSAVDPEPEHPNA